MKKIEEIVQESIQEALSKLAEADQAFLLAEDEGQGETAGGDATPPAPENVPAEEQGEAAPIEAAGQIEEEVELFVPSPDSLGEIDDHKFTSLLNRFRSAPSFTEGDRRDEFDKYWESLQPNERYYLYIAMLGFTQIVLKGASATEVVHPSNYGLSARSKKEKEVEEVVDGAVLPADSAAADLPDSTVAPIVVGEMGRSKKWRRQNAKRLQETSLSSNEE